MASASSPSPDPGDAELRLRLTGLHCASCVAAVEAAVRCLPGIRRVQVGLTNGAALVRYDPALCRPELIHQAISGAGYGIEDAVLRRRSGTGSGLRALQGVVLAVAVLVLHMGPHWLPALAFPGHRYVLAGLSVVILVGPGRGILWRALASALRLRPTMDLLVALGAGAAIAASLLSIFHPAWWPGNGAPPLFFDAAAVILAVVLIGAWLEERLRRQGLDAAGALLARLPVSVARRDTDGQVETVPLDALTRGDQLVLRSDATVPVDGIVIEGSGSIDESFLTGESLPREVSTGSRVLAGSIDRAGLLVVEVQHLGVETSLYRLAGLLERAQATRPVVARLADTLSALFVPLVVAIAVGTALVWITVGDRWLSPGQSGWAVGAATALAVLVVACPCALGLATPAAIAAAVARAARSGIVIGDGAALEALARCDLVACDKTGTLTTGDTRLRSIEPVAGATPHELLGAAAKLAHGDDHPVSRAILAAAAECGIPTRGATDPELLPGRGRRGRVAGQEILVGRRELLAEAGIDCAPIEELLDRVASKGLSPVAVARGGLALGVFGIGDSLRAEAPAAVAALQRLGLEVVLLTGDRTPIAEQIATEVGVSAVQAELLPEDKLARIGAWQDAGRRVVMVGDGVNDGPALAKATVGIAIGGGDRVALESAQVLVPGHDLGAVAEAVALARATITRIRQNLWLAFAYNLVAIPVAAGVLYPATGLLVHPGVAATAMACSSLAVMGNSLRLRRWRWR